MPHQHESTQTSFNLLTVTSGEKTMSSMEIAELTGKRHDNVMRDIRIMLVELHGEGGVLTFEDTYINPQNGQSYPIFRLPKRETLILVSGYNIPMRAKIIDRWEEVERQVAARPPIELSRLEILKLAMESEEAKLKAESERDEAIRTKALIGSKREATAMATASKEARARKQLEIQLDRSSEWASVKKMNDIHSADFKWQPLRKKSKELGVPTPKAFDPNFPDGVNTYHQSIWLAVYGVSI